MKTEDVCLETLGEYAVETDEDREIARIVERMAGFIDDAKELARGVTTSTTPSRLRVDIRELVLQHFDATTEPSDVADAYITAWNMCVNEQSAATPKGERPVLTKLQYMYLDAIAHCLVAWHGVARINSDGVDANDRRDMLATYVSDGPREGIYAECGSEFRTLIRKFNPGVFAREIEDVMSMIYDIAPIVATCRDKTLTPVANGIFDHETNTLRPFDPSLVFTSKIQTAYNPDAGGDVTFDDPEFGTWSLDAWLQEITAGDVEIIKQLEAVTVGCVRPRLKWEQAALLYNDTGSNGKGTLLAMWRNLVGAESCASVQLEDMSDRFALSALVGKSLNLVDEVPVGMYVENAAKFKALVTHDTITIDRKNLKPIDYKFEGFMVFCLNELPRIKDKTASMKRRMALISLPVSFTGRANSRIKSEYVVSREVAECLLHRALHSDCTKIPSSSASDALMNEFERENDPLLDFFDRVERVLCGDTSIIQPYKCFITTSVLYHNSFSYVALYTWYKGWRKKFAPKSSELSLGQFTKQINKIAKAHPERNVKINSEVGGEPVHLCGGQAAVIASDSQWGQFQMFFDGSWVRVSEGYEAYLNGEGSSSPITFRWCAETSSRRAKGLRFDVPGFARGHVPEEEFNKMSRSERKAVEVECHEHEEAFDFFECFVKESGNDLNPYPAPSEEEYRVAMKQGKSSRDLREELRQTRQAQSVEAAKQGVDLSVYLKSISTKPERDGIEGAS